MQHNSAVPLSSCVLTLTGLTHFSMIIYVLRIAGFLLGVFLLRGNAQAKTVFLRIAWGICLGISADFCVFLQGLKPRHCRRGFKPRLQRAA